MLEKIKILAIECDVYRLHSVALYTWIGSNKFYMVLVLSRFSLHMKNNMLELKQIIILILECYYANIKNNVPLLK